MGACCGKASRPSSGGDYQDADRAQLAAATEARIAAMENRGVTARGAAKLKENATNKKHDQPMSNDNKMTRTVS